MVTSQPLNFLLESRSIGAKALTRDGLAHSKACLTGSTYDTCPGLYSINQADRTRLVLVPARPTVAVTSPRFNRPPRRHTFALGFLAEGC